MHPSKFFKEVGCRTGIDTFELFDNDLKDNLINLHPMNFIKTKITLPVYKVELLYETKNGNLKQSDKYMVADNSDEEEFNDMWADMFARDYSKEHHLKNVNVLNISHICDAVLPIG